MKKTILSIIAVGCLVGVLSYPIITKNLIVDEPPVVSDVIVVAEGEENRSKKAAALLDDGYSSSDKIIVSPLSEANASYYKKAGVSRNQIVPETEATSTYENAVYTLEKMKEHGFDSAIVVSSDFHMLRTKMIYERINKDYDYDLTYVAAYHYSENDTVNWTETAGESNFKIATKEFLKFWGYFFGLYHFIDL